MSTYSRLQLLQRSSTHKVTAYQYERLAKMQATITITAIFFNRYYQPLLLVSRWPERFPSELEATQ